MLLDKLECEPVKILSEVNEKKSGFTYGGSEMKVSATCNRVAVLDGHTECMILNSVSFNLLISS